MNERPEPRSEWVLAGIEPELRNSAEAAARAAGQTIAEWLADTIAWALREEDAEAEDAGADETSADRPPPWPAND